MTRGQILARTLTTIEPDPRYGLLIRTQLFADGRKFEMTRYMTLIELHEAPSWAILEHVGFALHHFTRAVSNDHPAVRAIGSSLR